MAETTTTERREPPRVRGAMNTWSPPRGRERWRLSEGKAMVAALEASGETQAEFARRHGLKEARVQRWVGRVSGLRPGESEPTLAVRFAPVRLGGSARSGESGLEVVVGAAVVRVNRDMDDELLRRVVAALAEEPRC